MEHMKKITIPVAFAAIIGLSAFAVISGSNWTIDDGYSVKFVSEHPSGEFKTLTGKVVFDEKNLDAAVFGVTIDVGSIDCGNDMMSSHALGERWFDAAKYPAIIFVSQGATKTATGYETTGKLTMKGVTKDFTIPFTFTPNETGGVFTGKFDVNRVDFGVGSSGGKVPDVMNMEITVPVKN